MPKQQKDGTIYWHLPYGWRTGERYIPPEASAADIIRYEQEELGNALDVPDFLMSELEQKRVRARDIVWVCRTRDHARRYGGEGRGQPYQEEFGLYALVLATDDENETGYLILADATLLDSHIVEQFAAYRRGLLSFLAHQGQEGFEIE